MSKIENNITHSKEIIRSSSAEYLTFIAATGEGGVEAVYEAKNIVEEGGHTNFALQL
jgi:hypothetical protein